MIYRRPRSVEPTLFDTSAFPKRAFAYVRSRAKRLTHGIGALTVLTAASVFAVSPAAAMSLEEALVLAYLNNPTLLAERADLRQVDEGVPQALANWRPNVELTADAGVSVINDTSSTTDRNQRREPAGFGFEVTQPLFRGGQTLAATSEAENAVRASRARLLSVEQDVLLDAVTSYLDVFRDEAVLRLNINQEKVLTRQLEAARDRFDVGEITRTDVHQAEARLAGATADRIAAEGDLATARAAFENVIGELPPANLPAPGLTLSEPENVDDAVRISTINNPDVLAADFDRRAAIDDVDEQWGQLLPELEAVGSVTRDYDSTGESGRRDNVAVTLNLTVPLYQQGVVYSEVREAKQAVAELTQILDQERRDAGEAGRAAWEQLLSTRAQVDSFQTQIEANVVALEGVEREAAVGSRTVLDVLDAEQELLDSRVGHVQAQRDEFVALYQLNSALGRLTAKELKLPVETYDPTSHYREVRDKWFGTTSQGGEN